MRKQLRDAFGRAGSLGWLAIGLVPGLAVGWWAGSFTACRNSAHGCEVRVASIEAVGTWVGGLGTILALLAAVNAYTREDQARRAAEEARAQERRAEEQKAEQERRAEEQRAALEARLVVPQCMAAGSSYADGTPGYFVVRVTNHNPETDIYRLRVSTSFGPFDETLKLNRRESQDYSHTVDVQTAGMVPALLRLQQVRENWLREQATQVVLEFELRGRIWRKTGDAPPEWIGTPINPAL